MTPAPAKPADTTPTPGFEDALKLAGEWRRCTAVPLTGNKETDASIQRIVNEGMILARALQDAVRELTEAREDNDKATLLLDIADEMAEKLRVEFNALLQERDGAYGYLSRLFKSNAPQCEPFNDLMVLCTQIDNLIAGLNIDLTTTRAERDAAVAAHKEYLDKYLSTSGLLVRFREAFGDAYEDFDGTDVEFGKHLMAEVAALRARQLPEGCVAACPACMFTSDVEWAVCTLLGCPLRAAKEAT